MMPMTKQLLALADAFCAATSSGRGSVSNRIFTDGKRLDAIANGADLTTRSFERAMEWFDSNWPAGTEWPEGVVRLDVCGARFERERDGLDV